MSEDLDQEASGQDQLQQRLQDLLAFPREDIAVEIKEWLDLSTPEAKANIAKAAIALANSGGGYILIGFSECADGYEPTAAPPGRLEFYNQDDVNAAINRFAEPPFHCEVHHIPHPVSLDPFPVIIVPSGTRVPVRSKRSGPDGGPIKNNTYYIRRPGPKSESPQSGQEWDDLIRRCVRAARDELREEMRNILSFVGKEFFAPANQTDLLAEWVRDSDDRWKYLVQTTVNPERAAEYSLGTYTVAYRVVGEIGRRSNKDFLELLEKVKGRETGWPPWLILTPPDMVPYIYDNVVECWLGPHTGKSVHGDYWRASAHGFMFLRRAFQEDGESNDFPPGTIFDLTLPVWRAGECLLHAERLGMALAGAESTIELQMAWTGLAGRKLKTWTNPNRTMYRDYVARQDILKSRVKIPTRDISQSLPEVVAELTKPLYELFEFLEPPQRMFQEELARMRRGL